MKSSRIFLSALVAAGLGASFVCAAVAAEWTTYANPRFGTRAEVPLDGFAADPPPENGAGQSWTAADGKGRISVYGSFIVAADTFVGYREFTLNSARESGVKITYSAGEADWFVYSGTQGSDVVYMKALLSKLCTSPISHHVYLRYSAVQRKRYDSIATRLANSLRAGRGVDCD